MRIIFNAPKKSFEIILWALSNRKSRKWWWTIGNEEVRYGMNVQFNKRSIKFWKIVNDIFKSKNFEIFWQRFSVIFIVRWNKNFFIGGILLQKWYNLIDCLITVMILYFGHVTLWWRKQLFHIVTFDEIASFYPIRTISQMNWRESSKFLSDWTCFIKSWYKKLCIYIINVKLHLPLSPIVLISSTKTKLLWT